MILEHCLIEDETGHAAGRRLLARMYRQQTGLPMPGIRITDRGRPCFVGSTLYFSITHTKHHAFCALSQKPVGIDAEETDRKINFRLADKILSPMEKKQYMQAKDKGRALLTFWVLKEAYYKYLGTGIWGYPNETQFLLTDPRVTEREGCLVAVVEEDSFTPSILSGASEG